MRDLPPGGGVGDGGVVVRDLKRDSGLSQSASWLSIQCAQTAQAGSGVKGGFEGAFDSNSPVKQAV
jgi:hypothetical protein